MVFWKELDGQDSILSLIIIVICNTENQLSCKDPRGVINDEGFMARICIHTSKHT